MATITVYVMTYTNSYNGSLLVLFIIMKALLHLNNGRYKYIYIYIFICKCYNECVTDGDDVNQSNKSIKAVAKNDLPFSRILVSFGGSFRGAAPRSPTC